MDLAQFRLLLTEKETYDAIEAFWPIKILLTIKRF